MYCIYWQLQETYVIVSFRWTLYAYYEIDVQCGSTDKGHAIIIIIIIVFRHVSRQQIETTDFRC